MTEDIEEARLRGRELCSRGRYAAGRRAYRRAVRLAAAAGASRLHALAAEDLVRIDIREGLDRNALKGIELVISLWEQLGELNWRARVLRTKAEILERMDRPLDARLAWREARAALVDQGQSDGVSRCDSAIEDIGARIRAQARDKRRARARSDPSRRSVLGRLWSR